MEHHIGTSFGASAE